MPGENQQPGGGADGAPGPAEGEPLVAEHPPLAPQVQPPLMED